MPPFVYRSLKDFVRATATAQTRQELLQKLLTNAAKRKTQTHLDSTGARMSTFPEMFGRSLASDMGKQAFVGAGLKMVGRGISNFARNQLSGGLGKFVGNIGNGVRGLGTQTQRVGLRLGNAAQPLVNEVKDISGKLLNDGRNAVNQLPSWVPPAIGGGIVGASAANDAHNMREMSRPSPLTRPNTFPVYRDGSGQNPYSELIGAPMLNKESNLMTSALGPAFKKLRMLASSGMQNVGKGGARYMELLTASKLKNLAHKQQLMEQMRANAAPFNSRAMEIMRAVDGGGLKGQIHENATNLAEKLQHQALAEAAKVYGTRATTAGAGSLAAATGLAGVSRALHQPSGNNQPMLAKKSMTMPQPTSRGTMKKVQMPEASPNKPDCDPEGVQMSNNKQAFMGIGGLAGMATAPEGEEDLSIGRGALRGVGTGLGLSTGAVTGGLAGGLGGAGLGAILGAIARSEPRLSQRMGVGASQLGPIGMLAGGLGGAVYGGYKGNKATKALLDKTAPIGEKKKKNKEDDKEVKEAAATVLQLLHKNNPQIKVAAPTMEQYQRSGHAGTMSYQDYADAFDDNPSPTPAPAPAAPAPVAPAPAAPASPAQPQGGFFSRIGAKADASVNAAGNAITAPGRMLGDVVGSQAAGAYYAGQNAIRNVRRGAQNFGRTVNSYIPSFRSPVHFPNAQQNNMPQ